MDIGTIFDSFGGMLQVFVPAGGLPFVALILVLTWIIYQTTPLPKKLAPLIALVLGLAVAFFFLGLPWKDAIPCGLTLGFYAIAAWSGGKNLLELWKERPQEPRPPTEITD